MTQTRSTPPRRGISILEISAGAAMVTVLLTLLVQMLAQVRQYSRRVEDRAAMLRAVENLLEECTAAPWDAIGDEAVAALPLSDEVRRRWPGATLAGHVAASPDRTGAKQVTLTLTPAPDSRDRPVSLTTWVFKAPEQ